MSTKKQSAQKLVSDMIYYYVFYYFFTKKIIYLSVSSLEARNNEILLCGDFSEPVVDFVTFSSACYSLNLI